MDSLRAAHAASQRIEEDLLRALRVVREDLDHSMAQAHEAWAAEGRPEYHDTEADAAEARMDAAACGWPEGHTKQLRGEEQ